jgi:hypothetical protein
MHKKQNVYKWPVATVLCLCAVPLCVPAQSEVVINPKIETSLRYDTNYWQAEQSESAVLTSIARPGIELGYKTAKSRINLDATVDFFKYDDLDTVAPGVREAADDDYVGFTGRFDAKTLLTGRLALGLSEELLSTRDAAQSDPADNSVERREYMQNRITPKLYYNFGKKFDSEIKYRNSEISYMDEGEDSSENRGIFDLNYHLNELSKVYLNYQAWEMDYAASSSDYMSNRVTVNYDRQFNYFILSGGGGYHRRTFDKTADGQAFLDDLDLFSWNLTLSGQKPQFPAVQPRSRVALSLSQDLNTVGTGDEYFTATTVGLEVGYLLLHKIDTSINIRLQNSDYQESADNREDDTWTASGKMRYPLLRDLNLAVEAGYENRDSNVTGNSYDNVFAACFLNYTFTLANR